MNIKQNILEDVDFILSSRANTYIDKTATEKYFLYTEKMNLFEIQLKEMIRPYFFKDSQKLSFKTLGQIALYLQKKGERAELIFLLKKNIKNRNEITQYFWVDKNISKSMGISLDCINEQFLDQIIDDLESLILFCEWNFLISSKPKNNYE